LSLAPLFIYLLPVITVLAVAMVGSTRRLGFWLTLLLSIVLTPIGGFVATLLSGARRRKPKKRRRSWLGDGDRGSHGEPA
jgi:UPF0716 family protein affecting phage T7 exclusion